MKGRKKRVQKGIGKARLFHPPTIVRVLGKFGLSFRLRTSLQKMQNR